MAPRRNDRAAGFLHDGSFPTPETDMAGLTSLGIVHTAISLVAVAAGIAALVKHHHILDTTPSGRVYLWGTVLTCLTGFGIFQHGGFGKPHALGVITLLVLGLAWVAGHTALFGRASAGVASISYSLTLFFHTIPGMTETSTRLPASAPLASGPDDPGLQAAVGIAFLVFLAGAALQIRDLRRRTAGGGRALPVA